MLIHYQNMYSHNATLKAEGALSIAISGEIAGLYKAWKQHGRIPWKRLDGQLSVSLSCGLRYHHISTCRWSRQNQGSWQIRDSEIYLLQIEVFCSQEKPAAVQNQHIREIFKIWSSGLVQWLDWIIFDYMFRRLEGY